MGDCNNQQYLSPTNRTTHAAKLTLRRAACCYLSRLTPSPFPNSVMYIQQVLPSPSQFFFGGCSLLHAQIFFQDFAIIDYLKSNLSPRRLHYQGVEKNQQKR